MNRLGKFKYYAVPVTKGSHGTIFQGYYRNKHHKIAVKKVSNRTKARTEYWALRRIGQHHRTIRCYAFYQRRSSFYLVTKWVNGNPLGIRHRRRWIGQRHSVKSACIITIRLLQTLSYVHSKGVQYNDINPSNIVVHSKNPIEITMIDFGNAKISRSQRAFKKDVGRSAYLLGFLLHGNVARYSQSRFPKLPLKHVPASLRKIINKATHPRKEYRYNTTQSLIKALLPYTK